MSENENPKGNGPSETSRESDAGRVENYDIDLILDIPLNISVEFGRVRMLVNELLQLGQGSIIELSKSVGDPLEICINDKLIARGEVVVVDEKFGIRVTDIISTLERVKSLG